MSILAFPFAQAALAGDDPTVSFYWIRKALGQSGKQGCSDRRFVAYVDDLIAKCGFPRPLPAPKHGGGIELGVTHRSQWLRAGVVEWLGDYLPPDAAAALDLAAAADAAADMDAAASNLRLVGGTAA